MADKDFRVKNRLHVNGLSQTSGVILATNNALDSHTNVPTQYGGTGTTTSPNAGQILYSSAGTNYTPTDLSSLTISNTGGSTITASSASVKGLIIKGAASQTANLQEWQDSAGTVKAKIGSDGAFTIGASSGYSNFDTHGNLYIRGAGYYTANVNIKTDTTTTKGLVIRGSASQTANLQEWQNSEGTALVKIEANGATTLGLLNSYSDYRGTYGIGGGGLTTGTGAFAMKSWEPNLITGVFRGANSQTANLTEWQNSSGSVLAKIQSNGVIDTSQYLNMSTSGNAGIAVNGSYRIRMTNNNTQIEANAGNVTTLIVKGVESQTADLTEWQNNGGTTLAEVRSNGDIFTATKIGTASATPNIFGVVYGDGTSPTSYAEGSFSTNAGFASPAVFPNEEGWYPYFSYRVPDIVETSNDGASWTNRDPINYAGLFAYQTSYTSTTSNRYLRITMNQPTYTFLGLAIARFTHGTNNRLYTMKTELLDSSGAIIATYGPTAGTNVYDGAILAQKFNSYNGTTAATRITIENTQFVSGDSFVLASLMTYLSKPGTGKSFQSKFPMSWNSYKTTTFQPVQPSAQALIVKGKNQSVSISNAVGNGTTVTFTTTTNNEFVAGNTVNISGINPSTYNLGAVTIASVPTGNTFTVTNAATGTYVSGGTAAISQTANFQEWQTSSGSIIAKIDSNGVFNASAYDFGNNTGYPQIIFGGNNTTATIRREYRSSISKFGISTGTFHFGSNPDNSNFAITDNQVGVFGNNTSLTTFTVKSAASQTANLQEWQNSSGTVLSRFDASGSLYLGTQLNVNGGGGQGASIISIAGAASVIPIVAKGAASQTGDLQQWQNSAGTVLARINPYGDLYVTGGRIFRGPNDFGANLNITNESNLRGITIKGHTSQTVNLQEWQNSAGTVLASISAAGNLTVQDLTVNGTTTTINSTTLTVDDKNIELASVASPTDTTADGAGITIKGATDKTFNWVQSTGAFTSSEPISAPGISITGNSVSSNITLVSGKRYFVDTSAARTLTLPASPSLGDEIQVFDASGTAATNNMTINRNGGKINGVSDDLLIDVNGAAATLIYTGSTYGWVVR